MAIDLTTEPGISLDEATKLIPSNRPGKPTHKSRIIRAITQGSLDPDGHRVYLEALRWQNQWITSAAAVQRFVERLTPRQPDSVNRRSPAARTRQAAAAERQLDALGI